MRKPLPEAVEPDERDRWELIRDVLALQVKLVLDGVRDLLMVPISLAAALAGILGGGERPGRYFYELLRLGRRSEAWINLFGAADPAPPRNPEESEAIRGVDGVVTLIEDLLASEVERGGVTQSAKQGIDRLLDGLQSPPARKGQRALPAKRSAPAERSRRT